MGRPRSFDETEVLQRASAAFLHGYSATSVDDLVVALGLHRGSLYKAFGSKRGVFLMALGLQVDHHLPAAIAAGAGPAALIESDVLDLVLVAAMELSPTDAEARAIAARAGSQLEVAFGDAFPTGEVSTAASIFGARLWRRALQEGMS